MILALLDYLTKRPNINESIQGCYNNNGVTKYLLVDVTTLQSVAIDWGRYNAL